MSALRKAAAVFGIYFQEGLAYRASGVIWLLTDLGTAMLMPLVWRAAATHGDIRGFTVESLTVYYLALLVVSSVVTSHMAWEVGVEIKEGQFALSLLRPYSYLAMAYCRNLSWRLIRTSLVLPFLVVLATVYWPMVQGAHLYAGWEFWTALILGHLVSFITGLALAMVALFVQESMAIFELYYVPMIFLSGQLFPVALLPDWARGMARILPFYYTTGAPTEILVGQLRGAEILPVLGVQILWIGVGYVIYQALWSAGLKRYSAVGM